ncbi:MAG: Zn-dependent hydrolase [Pseudonocardiales bacterium]|nr:MAG: Zn-dependent hydrolase [Pseudonocardiales bacterium]
MTSTQVLPSTAPCINGRRLRRTLDELATFGDTGDGGVSRPAFSDKDIEARQYLAAVSSDAGLQPHVDEAGNLIVRRPDADPDRPTLLMGSHLDSVIGGGRLDGAYGVVAALEALRVLADDKPPMRYEPVAVAFANEEGALFPQPFWGAMALAGTLTDAERATDRDGRSIRQPLREAGGDLDAVDCAAWSPDEIAGYLEVHIEQGPVLEAAGVPIGVVNAIAGRTVLDIEIRGRQGHAGTTPMPLRRDAIATAARAVLAIEAVSAERRLCEVSTVGVLSAAPNVTNVIAGDVRLTAEIRDSSTPRLRAAEQAIRADLRTIADTTGTVIEIDVPMRSEPTPTDAGLRRSIELASDQLGHEHIGMYSGAGHDAQIVARLAPIGMIFVPSRDGISHAPDEDTAWEHLEAGAEVLLRAALLQ